MDEHSVIQIEDDLYIKEQTAKLLCSCGCVWVVRRRSTETVEEFGARTLETIDWHYGSVKKPPIKPD